MPETYFLSPVGWLHITVSGDTLTSIRFEDEHLSQSTNGSAHPVLKETVHQLEHYFAGELTAFDLQIAPEGTEFQRKVWEALKGIPYGTTISYMDLAKKLGDKNVIRAAGRANGQNPIPIVIPCHRVIGSDGSLTGYGGGIERKRWLLQHEGAVLL